MNELRTRIFGEKFCKNYEKKKKWGDIKKKFANIFEKLKKNRSIWKHTLELISMHFKIITFSKFRCPFLLSPKILIIKISLSRKDYPLEVLENKIAILNEYQSSNSSPQTLRTNKPQTTVVSRKDARLNGSAHPYELFNGKPETNGISRGPTPNAPVTRAPSALDNKTLRKYEFLGIDPTAVPKNGVPKVDPMTRSYHESLMRRNDQPESLPNIMSTSLIQFDDEKSKIYQFSNFSSDDYANSKNNSLSRINAHFGKNDGIEKLNGLVSELNEFVKENGFDRSKNDRNLNNENGPAQKFILPLDEVPCKEKESKFILPLEEIDSVLRRQRFSLKKCELKKLQSEQSRLMDAINNVKTKLLDIQQQKDEIIREVSHGFALIIENIEEIFLKMLKKFSNNFE